LLKDTKTWEFLWTIKESVRKNNSKEKLEIFVPIAHRLGLSNIKGELEVNSLKYYKPNAFISVEELLNNILEKRVL
jgi:GTP pyrophosphokinase